MSPEALREYKREWQRRWRRQQGMVPRKARAVRTRISDEERKARARARYVAKRQDLIAYQRAWKAANPERRRLHQRESNRRRDARITVTRQGSVSYRRILERDGPWCGICGVMIIAASLSEIHFDHIVPLSKGGIHAESNIQVAHAACNLRKHASLGP